MLRALLAGPLRIGVVSGDDGGYGATLGDAFGGRDTNEEPGAVRAGGDGDADIADEPMGDVLRDGDDALAGGFCDNLVPGRIVGDDLHDQSGDDTLDGGIGANFLIGGFESDVLRGGRDDIPIGLEIFAEGGFDHTDEAEDAEDELHGGAGNDVPSLGGDDALQGRGRSSSSWATGSTPATAPSSTVSTGGTRRSTSSAAATR